MIKRSPKIFASKDKATNVNQLQTGGTSVEATCMQSVTVHGPEVRIVGAQSHHLQCAGFEKI